MANSSVASQGGVGADSYGPIHRTFVNPGSINSFITQNTAGFSVTDHALGFSIQSLTSGIPAMTAVKPLHAKPYDVLVAMLLDISQVFGGHQAYGLCLRESSTGKLVTLGFDNEAWGNVTGIAHWTDAATPVSHTDNSIAFATVIPTYYRISDDGTTRTAYRSYGGIEFVPLLTEPSGTWCEPDQFGLIFQCERSFGNRLAMHAQSLEIIL